MQSAGVFGLLVLLLTLGSCEGCYEPGKVRGRASRASSSAVVGEPGQRFVLDSGDVFITMSVMRAVRARLEPLGVPSSAASIVADTVVVDVPATRSVDVATALSGGRLDIQGGDDLLIRGESLHSARVDATALVLVFRGTAKSALLRAIKQGRELRVKLDGAVLSRIEPTAYEGVNRDEASISVKMSSDRAVRLAKRLSGLALSHQTKLEQKDTP